MCVQYNYNGNRVRDHYTLTNGDHVQCRGSWTHGHARSCETLVTRIKVKREGPRTKVTCEVEAEQEHVTAQAATANEERQQLSDNIFLPAFVCVYTST